ncbi:unnamed protein product, partial [Arabidopsis halleri]
KKKNSKQSAFVSGNLEASHLRRRSLRRRSLLVSQFHTMVGRDLSPDLCMEDAMSYIDAVRAALEDAEPAKFEEFLRTFLDFGADRIGIAAFSASIQELLKDHVNLLLGFNVFLPLEFQITIPLEASTEFHKVVGRSVPPKPTMEDATSYLIAVKKAFHDEPAKYEEILKLSNDLKARRIGIVAFSASMQELLKDHVNLLLGFNVFLPLQFQINIPPEASTEFHKVVRRSVPPKPTMDDATSYLIAVKKAFHDEPTKYEEIIKLLNDLKARRVDAASVITRVEELMKDHLNLLLGFCVFLSATMSFITKVKARFQDDGSHVVDSVLQIMKMYSEGNKSKNDAYQEVGTLIQGHGDLLMELSEIFSDS